MNEQVAEWTTFPKKVKEFSCGTGPNIKVNNVISYIELLKLFLLACHITGLSCLGWNGQKGTFVDLFWTV